MCLSCCGFLVWVKVALTTDLPGLCQVGYGNETPPDLPRPLTVGQRVTGRHSLTRQIHDGTVLTVAANAYR